MAKTGLQKVAPQGATLTINGVNYQIKFKNKALATMQERYGSIQDAMASIGESKDHVNIKNLNDIIKIGLCHEQIEGIDDWLDDLSLSELTMVSTRIGTAIAQSFNEVAPKNAQAGTAEK